MRVRSFEQIEDLDISDFVNSRVAYELRRVRRLRVNEIYQQIVPQIEAARANNEAIDVDALLEKLWKNRQPLTLEGTIVEEVPVAHSH